MQDAPAPPGGPLSAAAVHMYDRSGAALRMARAAGGFLVFAACAVVIWFLTNASVRLDPFLVYHSAASNLSVFGGFALVVVSLLLLIGVAFLGTAFNRAETARRHAQEDARALGVQLDDLRSAHATQLLDLKHAEARLQRQQKHLVTLRAIDMVITSSRDAQVTLDALIDHVTGQLHVDAADVLLLNPETQRLEYAIGRGFRTIPQDRTLRLGEGYAGRAAIDRHPISLPRLPGGPGGLRRADFPQGEQFVAYYARPLIAKGELNGLLEVFHRSALAPNQDWLDLLDALAGQAAIAVDNWTLFNELQRSNAELIQAYDTTLEGWARALDLRDKETGDHSRRVTHLTIRLARAMRIPEAGLPHLRRGALLHDIGKMGIPDAVLLKPGPPTEEEWEVMR